jgi:pimeloyl-ACP methyl ester carboxylesterase
MGSGVPGDRRALPRASLSVLGDAGHFPWIECPGCVGAALQRLVAEVGELAAH